MLRLFNNITATFRQSNTTTHFFTSSSSSHSYVLDQLRAEIKAKKASQRAASSSSSFELRSELTQLLPPTVSSSSSSSRLLEQLLVNIKAEKAAEKVVEEKATNKAIKHVAADTSFFQLRPELTRLLPPTTSPEMHPEVSEVDTIKQMRAEIQESTSMKQYRAARKKLKNFHTFKTKQKLPAETSFFELRPELTQLLPPSTSQSPSPSPSPSIQDDYEIEDEIFNPKKSSRPSFFELRSKYQSTSTSTSTSSTSTSSTLEVRPEYNMDSEKKQRSSAPTASSIPSGSFLDLRPELNQLLPSGDGTPNLFFGSSNAIEKQKLAEKKQQSYEARQVQKNANNKTASSFTLRPELSHIFQTYNKNKSPESIVVQSKSVGEIKMESNPTKYKHFYTKPKQLEIVWKTKGKAAAKQYLYTEISTGQAYTMHCDWAIRNLCESSDQALDILHQMKENNISIEETTLNNVIVCYLAENKQQEAQRVIDVTFQQEGLTPNQTTFTNMEKAKKFAGGGLNARLKLILNQNGQQSALKMLFNAIADGTANTMHCNWSMKFCCQTSDQQRTVIEQMNRYQIPIDHITLTTLMNKLSYEGDTEGANYVLEYDFEKYWCIPSEATYKTLLNAKKMSAMQHMNQLQEIFQSGKQMKALKYLNNIILKQEADTNHCNWGANKLCTTSEQIQQLIHNMEKQEIRIDERILNQLLHQLILENKQEEAQSVFDNDFTKHGLTPDSINIQTMKHADKKANQEHMKDLYRKYGKKSSLKYLIELIASEKAEIKNCCWGMKVLCDTSFEAREIMQHMQIHGVPVTVLVLNLLIEKLLIERKFEEAQTVVDIEFKKYNLIPNVVTTKSMRRKGRYESEGFWTKRTTWS